MNHLIASHQSRPADDPIFALNREATQRKEKGESIVNATVGALLDDEGRLCVLEAAARAVHEVPAPEWAAYAPIAGSAPFLEAVMDNLLASEPRLREAAVAAATPGGTGALRHAIANFLEPGQALLTSSFYWGPYETLADEADRRVETFRMFTREKATATEAVASTYVLDTEALDAALARQIQTQGRALLFLNDPCHNPTGYSMRRDEWKKVVHSILAYASQAPVTVLVDCAYMEYGATDPRAFLDELAELARHAILLFAWSASKTYTHYGLRVGALVACVGDERERKAVEAAFSYSCRGTWSNCTRGGQAAVQRLLSDVDLARTCDAERGKLKTMLRARVDAFNRLARAKGLLYPRYDGGFFVTVFHEHAFEKAAVMKEAGVFVVPQDGGLRVALCSVPERDVPRLVEALV
jgi:aromatic-amino-acid transaminase